MIRPDERLGGVSGPERVIDLCWRYGRIPQVRPGLTEPVGLEIIGATWSRKKARPVVALCLAAGNMRKAINDVLSV